MTIMVKRQIHKVDQPEKEHQGLHLQMMSSSTVSAGPERYASKWRAVHKEQLPQLAAGMAGTTKLGLHPKYSLNDASGLLKDNGKMMGWHKWALVEDLKVDFPGDMYLCVDLHQLPLEVEASV